MEDPGGGSGEGQSSCLRGPKTCRPGRCVGGHIAAAQKPVKSPQWCIALSPNDTKTGRMTCQCFLRPIRRDLTSCSYTTHPEVYHLDDRVFVTQSLNLLMQENSKNII